MGDSNLLARIGVEHPIFQAPMGGGPSTPELVAAVSNAGGLGSLAAPYMKPEEIVAAGRKIRTLTDRPFHVNLFSGGYATKNDIDPGPMLAALGAAHQALGLPPPELPELPRDPFPEQLEAVLEVRPALFSFSFGIPPLETLRRVRAGGTLIAGTATTVAEARLLADAGVDAIAAQGAEAGAHRGTFAGPFESSMVSMLDLVRGIVAEVGLPVLAAGGIMDGRDVVRALSAGATAAVLGTAFLVCPESGAPEVHKRAILESMHDTTVVTRAYSGRPARGIENEFIRRIHGGGIEILPFGLQNSLTRPMRTASAKRGDPGFLSLWAGTGAPRARAMPAADLVRTLVAEMAAAR